jgi:hypothetical protein
VPKETVTDAAVPFKHQPVFINTPKLFPVSDKIDVETYTVFGARLPFAVLDNNCKYYATIKLAP